MSINDIIIDNPFWILFNDTHMYFLKVLLVMIYTLILVYILCICKYGIYIYTQYIHKYPPAVYIVFDERLAIARNVALYKNIN